jgi:hypothetical protein
MGNLMFLNIPESNHKGECGADACTYCRCDFVVELVKSHIAYRLKFGLLNVFTVQKAQKADQFLVAITAGWKHI